MSDEREKEAWLRPRWFGRLAWSTHRGRYRATGGRVGLRRARADRKPAWWLNLQAHAEASVDLADGRRTVRGRAAEGEDRW